MCGITGICHYKNHPIENIKAMNARIHHRGPDATGYLLLEKDEVILGHKRLSILELSDAGAQPMRSSDNRYAIVFNGEIYNFKEIKEKLKEDGAVITYRGSSDTEVLLEALSFYGMEKTLALLRGMFAFALYDCKERILYLARDCMGEKPLYYGRVKDSFVFASDLGSIQVLEDFEQEMDTRVLGLYFRYGYIPEPYSIYQNIYKLQKGSYLTVKAPFDTWKEKRFFSIEEVAVKGQAHPFRGSEEEATEELERILKRSVKRQMIADVPLGAFLSGGTDSTAVVSLMQSLSDKKVRTFTIGFEEEAFNEAKAAKEEAAFLETDHTELYVGFRDVMDLLPDIPKAFTEPFADSSMLPTMLVSKLAKEHVTVSLSGDGGDELFCGYNSYRNLESGLATVKQKGSFLPKSLRRQIGRMSLGVGAASPLLYKVGRCFTIDTAEDYKRALALSDCRIARLAKEGNNYPSVNDLYQDGLLATGHENLMLMDQMQYLPDDILVKVDRAGMFYSLENRIPLLDRDIVEFSWSLPLAYKFDGITSKKILKNLLYRYVPREMMERKKTGFAVPVSLWLQSGEMRDWAESILSDGRELAKEYLDVKLADSMWKDLTENGRWLPNIWYVLMFEQWLLANRNK